jgi:hypothetical protein
MRKTQIFCGDDKFSPIDFLRSTSPEVMAIALCKELLLPNSSFKFSSVNNSHFGVFSSRPKTLDLPERRSRNRSETIMRWFAITNMRSIYLILFKINFGNNTTIRV